MRSGSGVQLYTRRDCSLCEEMRQAFFDAAAGLPFQLVEVDIDGDPLLVEKYGMSIPLLSHDGRTIAKIRADRETLRRRLLWIMETTS